MNSNAIVNGTVKCSGDGTCDQREDFDGPCYTCYLHQKQVYLANITPPVCPDCGFMLDQNGVCHNCVRISKRQAKLLSRPSARICVTCKIKTALKDELQCSRCHAKTIRISVNKQTGYDVEFVRKQNRQITDVGTVLKQRSQVAGAKIRINKRTATTNRAAKFLEDLEQQASEDVTFDPRLSSVLETLSVILKRPNGFSNTNSNDDNNINNITNNNIGDNVNNTTNNITNNNIGDIVNNNNTNNTDNSLNTGFNALNFDSN